MSNWRTILLISALAAACGGDDAGPGPDAPSGDILDQIRALPEVQSAIEGQTDNEGYRYFEILFSQPLDHDNPSGPRFFQYATLIHRDVSAPFVLLHTGYGNWYYDFPSELTRLLDANQLVVEHRFFRGSRPTGVGVEAWNHLTIEQSAADHHRITQAMRRLYTGRWLETGASKGGMTSVYHRRFYPDDVDATVAYVAPISFAAPDYRYEAHLEQLGPPACRQALRDLQVEMLSRRGYLEQRAAAEAQQFGLEYNRVALPVAVEGAVESLEWAFWQYVGAESCDAVPPVTAADSSLWNFLRSVSAVSGSSDDDLAEFEAYYYQAEVELGYPGTMDEHIAGLLVFDDNDWRGAYPEGVTLPPYSDAPMRDIDTWVQREGERLLFIYGEWDPWSGGMFSLGNATDSMRVVAPQAPHGAAIADLTPADQTAVLAWLAEVSGVQPNGSLLRLRERPRPPEMRVRRPR